MITRVVWICILVASLAMPLVSAQTSPSDGVEYRLEIACPGVGAVCPVQAVDGADAMGDPSLAVDPFRPTRLILASLHGGANNEEAPTLKSRSGQAFTTFTSANGGEQWRDNPFFPPSVIETRGIAYGETSALTIAPYGHAFVGSLYSVPRAPGQASAGFDYVLAAQKFRNMQAINDNQRGEGDYNAQFLTAAFPGNRIEQTWFEFNIQTDNMTVVWLEKKTPHSAPAVGGPQAFDTFGEARLYNQAVANSQAPLPLGLTKSDQIDVTEPRSMISVGWTTLDAREEYHFLPTNQSIGPCQAATNPVMRQGWLYLGCQVADEGPFRWNPDAEPGDVELFRMDPDGGEPEYLGPAPVSGGAPKMGVRSDGRVAVMIAGAEDGELVLEASYGQLNDRTGFIEWGKVHSYGEEVPQRGGWDVDRSNIQDMVYREYSGVVHIILKQNLERDAVGTPAPPFSPTVHKSLVAVDEKHGFLVYHNLDVGNIINRSMDGTLLQYPDPSFDDITDDYLVLPAGPYRYNGQYLGDLYERMFFAVGDYGIVQFAEIVEVTDLRGPGVATVQLPPPPSPAPAPAAVSSTALAGALSGAAATSLTAAKMKKKAAVGAKKNR